MRNILCSLFLLLMMFCGGQAVCAQNNNIIDEVIWVVGDEAILKSDVESARREAMWNQIDGNPYCVIPERIAIQKLFLHQAAIDSIEVSDQNVNAQVEEQINDWVMKAGSREKLEEYMNASMTQIREDLFDEMKNQYLVEQMKKKLTEEVKVTPAEVRRYFKDIPEDSLPFVNTQVEVEIFMRRPVIPVEEIDRVKDELRGYAERVNNGESFSFLARSYCEDGTARSGGELGFATRMDLDPAFANVAFSLNDTKKVSKVVESEFGFHIIQLIEKRGDKINVRHIIRKPRVAQVDIDSCMTRLDTIAEDIRQGKLQFEEAVALFSDDKDTRNNHGLMFQEVITENGRERTSRFEMGDLANMYSTVARVVDGMETGEISKPFLMEDKKGHTVCAIVKLRSRIKAHRANAQDDFQRLRKIVYDKKCEEVIEQWIRDKQRTTYVRINEAWRDCEFQYPGWVK